MKQKKILIKIFLCKFSISNEMTTRYDNVAHTTMEKIIRTREKSSSVGTAYLEKKNMRILV